MKTLIVALMFVALQITVAPELVSAQGEPCSFNVECFPGYCAGRFGNKICVGN